MKKFAKFLLCTLLIAVSCTALLVGCQTTEDKLKNSPLIGNWECRWGDNKSVYVSISYDAEFGEDCWKWSMTECERGSRGNFFNKVQDNSIKIKDNDKYEARIFGGMIFIENGIYDVTIVDQQMKLDGRSGWNTDVIHFTFNKTSLTLEEWKTQKDAEFN